MALWKRDAKRAATALGAIALAGGLWLLHAQLVAARGAARAVSTSPGWVRFGGLPLVIDALRRNLLLTGLPGPLVLWPSPPHSPRCCAGAGKWNAPPPSAGAGFLAALTVFGRADNGYWGFMAAPFVLLGWPLIVREVLARLKR